MTNVLCWPLKEAEACLGAEGLRVELREARPRKPMAEGQKRVVRQQAEEGLVRLTWANFKA